ncbi:DUF4884 domain-containing protein [Terrimonas alba]|uniref:DUF4884 domain-containing protein n=1 Tax=Terrimonas alba TaxID=3349636 RepID=UPI0035F37173
MNRILPVILLFLASGCVTQTRIPLREGKSQNNKTYNVDYLFEHEGCKVYRFYDRGNYVYFTNCRGETIVKTDSTEVRNTIKVKGQ